MRSHQPDPGEASPCVEMTEMQTLTGTETHALQQIVRETHGGVLILSIRILSVRLRSQTEKIVVGIGSELLMFALEMTSRVRIPTKGMRILLSSLSSPIIVKKSHFLQLQSSLLHKVFL